MFIALVSTPYIGMHELLSWDSRTYVIDADDEDGAIEIIKGWFSKKNPEVQKQLLKERGDLKEGEYFSVRLHGVPENIKLVSIYEPSTGFNLPYKKLWL